MNSPSALFKSSRSPQSSLTTARGTGLLRVHWLGYLRLRKFLTAAFSMAAMTGLHAAAASDESSRIEVLFDDGYALGGSLADQEPFGWQRIAPFASPEIRQDGTGRPGAFSIGEEARAVLPTDYRDTSSKPVRLEFAAAIPAIEAHLPSFVQVGFLSGLSAVPHPVITVSAMGLLFGKGIEIGGPEVQRAYRGGEPFQPAPGKTIHVRCDFDPEANTASISVSEDGGETYEELSTPEGGMQFSFEPFPFFDHLYLRLGTSPSTGIYSIVVG